jgi:zeaxanthin epoxidase
MKAAAAVVAVVCATNTCSVHSFAAAPGLQQRAAVQTGRSRSTLSMASAAPPANLKPTGIVPPDEISEANPLRVILSGGGVGGLMAAKYLKQSGFDVTVFEKTDSFRRFGGPIQLASNALSTIKAIDADLFTELMKKFTFTGVRTNGIMDG